MVLGLILQPGEQFVLAVEATVRVVGGVRRIVELARLNKLVADAKLAGELCEGFHAHPFNSPRYLQEVMIPAIEEGAKKKDRKREDVSVSVSAFIATTPEEMNFARAQISFYASTPSYRSVMDLHGWSSVAETLSKHAAKGEWAEMPMLITDEMLSEFCLVTEEDKLAEELKKRYEGIADRLTLYSPFIAGEKDEWWKKLVGSRNEN